MRRYERLRKKMREEGITGNDLARWMRMNPNSISARMTGRVSWSLQDAYQILDYLSIPREELYDYFPPDGKDAELTGRMSPAFEAAVRREVNARIDAARAALAAV